MTTPADGASDGAFTSRRALLLGAGAVGAAGLLAACASDPPTAGAPRDAAPPPAASTTGPPSTVPPSAAPIHKSDIPVGGGKIYADSGTVVTQPTAGEFKAFDSTCKHAGCTVGTVESGLIICPCHGSEYRITDGSVARGPATSGLDTKTVAVSGDTLTVT